MAKVNDLHNKWMNDKKYRKAHEDLAPEFALARAVIEARSAAGLTQEQLAKRMDTTQSVIARLEVAAPARQRKYSSVAPKLPALASKSASNPRERGSERLQPPMHLRRQGNRAGNQPQRFDLKAPALQDPAIFLRSDCH